MSEILEVIMLLCFGFSWPISLIRNIKAKSAKNMSLGFILLIIAGYIAGISSKLFTHNYSYVLIVYIFNLLVVGANLVIYFVNCAYDRQCATKRKPNKKQYNKIIMEGTH